MSTRFYPRFLKGNPQLRVFLPDWKVVMVKNKDLPNSVVTFKIDPRMTDWDLKNYLNKIYNVEIGAIKSEIFAGRVKFTRVALAKDADYKLAYIALPIGTKFDWPTDLFKKQDREEEDLKDMELLHNEMDKFKPKKNWFDT